VLKRAKDGDILFRSAYNLGNLAFANKDFDAAVQYYKKALAAKPGDEDARANLQLALWWKKQAKQAPQEPGQQQGKNGKTGESNKQGETKTDSRQSTQQPGKAGQTRRQETQPGQGQQTAEAGGQGQSQTPQNLDGVLKPMQEQPDGAGPQGTGKMGTGTAMAKNRAAALLDNAQDNMKIRMQTELSQGKTQPESGKGW